MSLQQACPCGSAAAYDGCCGRLHRGAEQAATPEELMRSRYTAYAVRDSDYVWRTWHPRTRPLSVAPDPDVRWTGLVVHDAVGDEVEFTATFERLAHGSGPVPGRLHERSTFAQRAGRWFYVAATSASASS